MQAARPAIGRLGSRRVLLVAAPGSAALLAGVGLAPTYPWFLVAAGLVGAAFRALDIGMKAQGAVVGRRSGRHLIKGAHARRGIRAGARGGTRGPRRGPPERVPPGRR